MNPGTLYLAVFVCLCPLTLNFTPSFPVFSFPAAVVAIMFESAQLHVIAERRFHRKQSW